MLIGNLYYINLTDSIITTFTVLIKHSPYLFTLFKSTTSNTRAFSRK